jgi:hypothetical protein
MIDNVEYNLYNSSKNRGINDLIIEVEKMIILWINEASWKDITHTQENRLNQLQNHIYGGTAYFPHMYDVHVGTYM